jgi:hypothetical protein
MEPRRTVFGVDCRQHFDDAERLFKMIASIAAIVGIFFAAEQIKIATDNARRQTTLELFRGIQDEMFILAFQRLNIAKEAHTPLGETYTERFLSDKNLVLSRYNSIAINYDYGTVDKCLVKTQVRVALGQLIQSMEYLEVPATAYDRVTKMRINLDALLCPTLD